MYAIHRANFSFVIVVCGATGLGETFLLRRNMM